MPRSVSALNEERRPPAGWTAAILAAGRWAWSGPPGRQGCRRSETGRPDDRSVFRAVGMIRLYRTDREEFAMADTVEDVIGEARQELIDDAWPDVWICCSNG